MLCHAVYSIVVTASEDASIKVGDLSGDRGRATQPGLFFSSWQIWDSETGQVDATLRGHTNGVTALALDAKGEQLGAL